jgi:hypothetical protein
MWTELSYIKFILANCANEYESQKCGGQHIILIDLVLLTVLTYRISTILMELGLLTVFTE